MAGVRVRHLSSPPLIVLLFSGIFAVRKYCFINSDSLENYINQTWKIIASHHGIDLIGLSETHMNTNISI